MVLSTYVERTDTAFSADSLPTLAPQPARQNDSKDEQRAEKLSSAVATVAAMKLDSEPILIEEGLYVGSVGAACNKEALDRLGITHIVCVMAQWESPFPTEYTHHQIRIMDTTQASLLVHLDPAIEFVTKAREEGGRVLVHCFAGRSRSISVATAVLMKQHSISMDEALARLREKRPIMSPNPGFIEQLRRYEGMLLAERASERASEKRLEPTPAIQQADRDIS
ncbi:Dual specificity phosphatase [Klebsormidium nitens]|uniref:Dual specificity phosphatase n=1 Tax=Klebsormidium nitens TaxID=105231 RepID=A0A1Y1HY95_KLENI|nr:Dual specificity phosphatase [Klebsormidium nitens]|eukprot:GAQ82139.1 Dual specificity phosphatase [Klebsormidium nitens]